MTDRLGTDCPQLPRHILCPGANLPNVVSNPGFLPAARASWKLGTRSLGENLAARDWRVRSLDPQPETGMKGPFQNRVDQRLTVVQTAVKVFEARHA